MELYWTGKTLGNKGNYQKFEREIRCIRHILFPIPMSPAIPLDVRKGEHRYFLRYENNGAKFQNSLKICQQSQFLKIWDFQ